MVRSRRPSVLGIPQVLGSLPSRATRPPLTRLLISGRGHKTTRIKAGTRSSWGTKLWPAFDKEALQRQRGRKTLLPPALCTHVSEMKMQRNNHVSSSHPGSSTNYAFFSKWVCVCVDRSIMSNSVIPLTAALQKPLYSASCPEQELWVSSHFLFRGPFQTRD